VLSYSHTLINAPLFSPCLLYTLSITHILICSTRYYTVLTALELCKAFNTVTKANFSSELATQYSGQYLSWAEVIIEREISEILNGILWNFIQFRFNGPILFSKCLMPPNKFYFYIKRCMIIYRYNVPVTSWHWLSKFYTELTLLWENFFPWSTVPICGIAMDRSGTFCAVEHKKLRITHNL